MLSRLAATVGFFSASAFARKSAISPSSQLSSTRCSQRRRRLSTSLSSAPCRPTINSESRCWKPLPDATSSNCSAISRPAFPPPLRYTAAFKARLGARTCIRPCVVRSLRLTPISTWYARLFEATGVGTFLLTDFKDNLQTLLEPNREVVAWRSVNECHCGPTSVLGAPLTVRPKIAKVPASHAI